ncbi:MAG: two-component regulator propeller domain-containing protein, partial [Bacteroidota bacterium]
MNKNKLAYMVFKRFLLGCGFFILWYWPAFGQLGELNLTMLDKEVGLSDLINSFVYRDSKGLVWISSLEGLNCYDGESVKTYTALDQERGLKNNLISSSFFEDDQENLWFSSYKALQFYDRSKDSITAIQLYSDQEGNTNIDYYAFHFEQNLLWFRQGVGGNGRIYTWDTVQKEFSYKGRALGNRQYLIKDKSGKVDGILATMIGSGGALFYPL